jgi:SAM-dependent methyltransferase
MPLNKLNSVSAEIYILNDDGSVRPNPIFHRPWDKLHSRCIEYPYGASKLGDAKKILDVGTVKSDPLWIRWLKNLPLEVHATDFDLPDQPFRGINFHQADVRNLPINSSSFDKILAISVIEHIGLDSPQVLAEKKPESNPDGDIDAVRELIRLLRPEGELIMTFPFGQRSGRLPEARLYSIDSLDRFKRVAKPVSLDYYEYQYARYGQLYPEFPRAEKSRWSRLKRFVRPPRRDKPRIEKSLAPPAHLGAVTWRRQPLEQAQATHFRHIDGVLCGVWKKLDVQA